MSEKVKKISDEELGAISGGQKYNIGNIPVYVSDYPDGPAFVILNIGDYLVTDGQSCWSSGILWRHVYTAYGAGWVNGALVGY